MLLGKLAKWLLLNSKAGAIALVGLAGLLLAAVTAYGVTAIQLKQARDALVPVAQELGRARGQLDQLAADSERRAEEARKAVEAANKRADALAARSRVILQTQPSHPDDLCRSADELIRQELEQR